MQTTLRILIPLLISIALAAIISIIDKENRKASIESLAKDHVFIRLPRAYLWVASIDILFFLACILLMIYFPNDTVSVWVYMLFCLFISLGVLITVATLVWKVEVLQHENYFLIRTTFGRSHRIEYKDCLYYKFSSNYLVIKTNKKTFYIDINATNFEFLLATLKQHSVKETL